MSDSLTTELKLYKLAYEYSAHYHASKHIYAANKEMAEEILRRILKNSLTQECSLDKIIVIGELE